MLKAGGWCWGRADQAEYQKSWVRCAAPAAAAKPPLVASADAEDNMNSDQQACNLLTAYGFAVADWRNNGVPFERVYANVTDVLRPPLPKWSRQTKQWWLDQYVSVYKDNTGTPPSVIQRRLKSECRAPR